MRFYGGRQRGKLVCWKVQTALRPRSWQLRKKANAKIPDTLVVESTPRHSSASNGFTERPIRTTGEPFAMTLRNCGFCVTRYARGAGGITSFRAAYDRDYTREIVPLTEKPQTVVWKETLQRGHRVTPRARSWEKERSGGSENNAKARSDETCGNVLVCRDSRFTSKPGTEFELRALATAKTTVWSETLWKCCVDRCDAAPELEQIQENLFQKICSKSGQ